MTTTLSPSNASSMLTKVSVLDPLFLKGLIMLDWALTFLIIALLAGLFGFGLVGGMAYGAAKICFFVFLVLAIVSMLTGRRLPR